jgi:hypothetical protein
MSRAFGAQSLSFFVCRFFYFTYFTPPDPVCAIPARPVEAIAHFHTDLLYVAVNKDAFPIGLASAAGRIKSFCLPKQAQVSSVIYQAQYQAFVRVLRSKAAQLDLSHRAQKDLRFGTFHSGAGSRLRTWPQSVCAYGASNPGPMLSGT